MAEEQGKSMSLKEFNDLLAFIMENHSWNKGIKGHAIKYVRPHWDTRTGDFFGVTFDGLRGHKDFFIVNENRHRNLVSWIMEFLNTPPDESKWEDGRT